MLAAPESRTIDDDPFAHLTPAQHQAVRHDGGPLLILAGAGTGKTTTLAARVARLVADGVDPQRILLLTFTRRAAAEMLSRAGRMVRAAGASPGMTATSRVVGGTFHACANRLLRRYGERIGMSRDFGLLDAADTADLLDLVRDDLRLAAGRSRFPRKSTLAAIHSRVVNSRIPLETTLEHHFPWCIDHIEQLRRLFRAYRQRKHERNLLDYDDLLLHWKVLAEAPGVGTDVAAAIDHVLVDEYQDTNALQVEILQALRRSDDRLTVVGDDAQAIYAFRAASVTHIRQFPQTFPGTTVVRLERSHRSTQPILDVANALVLEMPSAYAKSLHTERRSGPRPRLHSCDDEADQTDRVCQGVLRRREEGTPLRRQAVLFRTGHHSGPLEVELTRRNIPFVKYGGLRYLEAAHVKDLVALLRLLDNPDDELAWFRLLQRVEGIGPATARRLIARMLSGGQAVDRPPDRAAPRLRSALAADDHGGSRPDDAVAAQLCALADALHDAAGLRQVGAQVERLRRWYTPVARLAFDDPEPRLADLAQLEVLAGDGVDVATFLDALVLDPPASTGDLAGPPHQDEDYLILSTIHSAKGLEWDTVHLLHAADGMIPSDMATGRAEEIEEERRLLYVALTRPRHELDVYVPLRYYHQRFGTGDRHSLGQVSRFLQGAVRPLMEAVGPQREAPPVPVAADGVATAAVDALLEDLW